VKVVREVTSFVNESVRQGENQRKLFALHNIFVNQSKYLGLCYMNLIQPHRHLLKDGKLYKRSLRDNSLQLRHVYLCNDVLITVTQVLGNYLLQKTDKIIPLYSATIIDCPVDSYPDSDRSFFLVSPVKTLLFVTKNHKEKMDWMLAIQNAIVEWVNTNPEIMAMRERFSITNESGIWQVHNKSESRANDEIDDDDFVIIDSELTPSSTQTKIAANKVGDDRALVLSP